MILGEEVVRVLIIVGHGGRGKLRGADIAEQEIRRPEARIAGVNARSP